MKIYSRDGYFSQEMKDILFAIIFLCCLNSSWNAVLQEDTLTCSVDEFHCNDGTCVRLSGLCDGRTDCRDGSDELSCNAFIKNDDLDGSVLTRTKRQNSGSCSRNQFRCNNGQCIPADGECDGRVDCTDRSDESYAQCRNTVCNEYLFHCSYGACVDGDAKCNGVRDCADNSDEARCGTRNITGNCSNMQWQCNNGDCISKLSKCDGVADCSDVSDESVAACESVVCPELYFRCAYGACVDGGSDCNGIKECADGSDEDYQLCGGKPPAVTTNRPTQTQSPGSAGGLCSLPPYPKHGKYEVQGNPNAKPGIALKYAYLQVTCDTGFRLTGSSTVYCSEAGVWNPAEFPTCERLCRLKPQPSVSYTCRDGVYNVRKCNEWEPSTTIATASCNDNYYSPYTLPSIRCREDSWDNLPTCQPDCGVINPEGTPLVVNGWTAERGEFPWHVGIYDKNTRPYKQICGGSIITTTIVISAAHCFWRDPDGVLPASSYAVAAGKRYRPWNESHDPDAQKSDVSELKIPTRFRGSENSYQSDVALVFLTTPFQWRRYILPVCLDFDHSFSKQQLTPGSYGKVAGWGVTEQAVVSQILLTVTLPVVSYEDCISNSPPAFRPHISADKFCAGYLNGTGLCQGDSGGGLAFPSVNLGKSRYYLRGIVSTAPKGEDVSAPCKGKAYTTFTDLSSDKIEEFIRPHYNYF